MFFVRNLKRVLKKRLKCAGKIAVLGVGSELRGDDAAGMLLASRLKKSCRNKNSYKRKFKVFLGATAPENLTGQILRFRPTHLLILDSADVGKKAGTITLIDPEETAGVSFCTHRLPIKIMADYLNKSAGCQTLVIGIQPKQIEFGNTLSLEVTKSSEYLSKTIEEILKG